MRELTIEERLTRMEENIVAIKMMLEEVLTKPAVQPAIEDDKAVMNVKQVARFLGVDVNVVYAKCAKGDFPYFKIGKQYRFKKADVLKWVKGLKEDPGFSVDEYVDRYMQGNILKA